MKNLKLSKLSKSSLNKRQMKQIKGGEMAFPCICWGECRDYPDASRRHWRMGPRMS